MMVPPETDRQAEERYAMWYLDDALSYAFGSVFMDAEGYLYVRPPKGKKWIKLKVVALLDKRP